jgi:hypothetical protein
MVIITEEHSDRFSFENTRNGFLFDAWLDEETGRWVIVREGDNRAVGDFASHRVGTIEPDGDAWIGYAGTLPSTKGTPFETRKKALAWVTDDREQDATGTSA